MANFLNIRDGNGALQTIVAPLVSGSLYVTAHVIVDPTNTYTMPTLDAVGRAGYVFLTDGTHTAPTMDAVGRAGYQFITDGTHTMPTGDAAGRPIFVEVTNGTQTLPTGDAAARGIYTRLTNGTNTAAVDAGLSLQTGTAPLGTPIYNGANAGATQNVATLTIPSAVTGYLDGFDLDGLGATAGSAIAVTVAGLLGGTLTFQIGIPAGITTPFTLSKRFNPPLKASAANTNIVVTVPSYGSGNTAASVNAYGHYY